MKNTIQGGGDMMIYWVQDVSCGKIVSSIRVSFPSGQIAVC